MASNPLTPTGQPLTRVPPWTKGRPLTAANLNQVVDAFNRTFGGINPPQQNKPGKSTASADIYCRDVVLPESDAANDITLKGLITHNGITYVAGDIIAVIRTVATPKADDGIYSVNTLAWTRLYRFDADYQDSGTTLEAGDCIRIWDGYEAPGVYMIVGSKAFQV